MAKKVTKIPAAPGGPSGGGSTPPAKRRACGYARVSTDKETQESSFDNQMRHYTEYIQSRPDLEFVGMYSDEGITGTSTKHRDGFNRMVQDALDGKIDLIITKSVSRFARNTVDSLTTIRRLKEKGVEVYFEEQNIYTFDARGELLITIMSSLAQEEAHNISDNTKWGKRKSFADGKVSVAYSHFLGYDKGPNGGMVINQEQAQTVRLIYKWFLQGLSCYAIAKRLGEMGIKTPMGKDRWQTGTVISILSNEKYKGDALLQKTYTDDFMTKRSVKNDGSAVPQYYVQGDHEAIIDPATFDQAQAELKRRRANRRRYSGIGIFSSKVVCGDCGGWYGAKVIGLDREGHKKIVYRCNQKYDGDRRCRSPFLAEERIKEIFITAVNRLITDRESIIANMETLLDALEDTRDRERRLDSLAAEMERLDGKVRNHIEENSHRSQDQAEYQHRYDRMIADFNQSKKKHKELAEELDDVRARAGRLRQFIADLEKTDAPVREFDDQLWCAMVDHITAYSADDVRVTFRSGAEVRI